MTEATTLKAKDFKGKFPNWCPGCGDFGVLTAMQRAAANLGLAREELVITTGIGCSGNFTAFFQSYGFHGIHGRALPAATGIHLANPELTNVIAGGDGDGFGIGLGHFMHAARRNLDLCYVVMDNQVYGLTKGQTSPTTPEAESTKASPLGPLASPVRPLELALTGGATFIAQGFSGDLKQLVPLLEAAVQHRGFSLVNVQSPCITYNAFNTYEWFREHTADVAEEGHDPSDLEAARRVIRDTRRVPTGILYQVERPTFLDGLDRHRKTDTDALDPIAAAGAPAAAIAASCGLFDGWLTEFQVRS
ncbi:MAG: 2-oxoacid:ferredoxin oxidoreductase subunit beta [Thermoplasmatota archaeon]